MDCTNLNTAAQILEAFRVCNDAGEQIELFECLATRPEPPVEAFVDLLRRSKLEPVLALTIQAFGKITNADIKAQLKQSDDLLEMLSQQAQSGSTDLIRWSAATTIESIGFDFITISQHLTEEPRNIAEKIVQSKVKRFADQNLVQSNDYDTFVRFWTYRPLYKLREITVDCDFFNLRNSWQSNQEKGERNDENVNKFDVCWQVMSALGLRGLKEVNSVLQIAEEMGESALAIDENEVFEGIAQALASERLKVTSNPSEVDLLITLQVQCLYSNNFQTRHYAALLLSTIYGKFEKLRNHDDLGRLIDTFSEEFNSVNYSYKQLQLIASNLETISDNLSRSKVRQDCLMWLQAILKVMEQKRSKFEERTQKILSLWNELEIALNRCRDVNPEIYDRFFGSFHMPSISEIPFKGNEEEDEKLIEKNFNLLRQSIKFIEEIKPSCLDYYQSLIQPLQERLRGNRHELSNLKKKISDLENSLTKNPNTINSSDSPDILSGFLGCLGCSGCLVFSSIIPALLSFLLRAIGIVLLAYVALIIILVIQGNIDKNNQSRKLSQAKISEQTLLDEVVKLEAKMEKLSRDKQFFSNTLGQLITNFNILESWFSRMFGVKSSS